MQLLILALASVFLYALYIRKFKGIRQYEREEGLKSHQGKTGTITMGGLIFAIVPLFFIWYDLKTLNIAITISMYAFLGFTDDLLIILRHNNKGIPPSIKLLLQVCIAGISFFLYLYTGMPTSIDLFHLHIDLKWVYGIWMLFILTSSTNAFNLTDGVDGLCSGLAILISIAFMYVAYQKNEYGVFYMIVCITIPLFVFWCFNYPKAFLFMGDTGSLFLGSFYAMLAIYLNCILLFIVIGLLFIFETISVILQVFYYKKTKGKRIFKMAPFHHHLEACGLSEVQVDLVFYVIQIILIVVGIATCI